MEIHYADKDYRKRTLWLIAGFIMLCTVLLWQLHQWLQNVTAHLADSDPDTVRRWLRAMLAGLGIALAAPAAALGIGLRRLGFAARLQGRFPPQDWKTLRDVHVLRDLAALNWAKRVEAAGGAALALAIALAAWSAWAWWHYRG